MTKSIFRSARRAGHCVVEKPVVEVKGKEVKKPMNFTFSTPVPKKVVRKHTSWMHSTQETHATIVMNGVERRVKADNWYVVYPAAEGSIGYPWLHCLVRNGHALFATTENYLKPRMYKPLSEFLKPEYNTIDRRS